MVTYDIALRAQAMTLRLSGYRYAEVERLTGISRSALQHIIQRAKERGFDPEHLTPYQDS